MEEVARARAHYAAYGTPLQYSHGSKTQARIEFGKFLLVLAGVLFFGVMMFLSYLKHTGRI